MGMIYKRKDGTTAEAACWYIKYYRDGRPIFESTGTTKEKDARDLLKLREGDITRGVPVTPKTNRVTFRELTDDVLTDYRVNGKRSAKDAERRVNKHLLPFFGDCKAAAIGTDTVRKYVAHRQDEGAENATINRELALLKRAFSLAMKSTPRKVMFRPAFDMLAERNTRTGFFEEEQFSRVQRWLPEPVQRAIGFAYVTGWRIQSEVLPLQWRQVDFAAGWVRLDADTTKNGERRVFLFTDDLQAVLDAQRAYTDTVQRTLGAVIPWVFHRNGKPIRSFRRIWKTACKKAGCPGMIPHDCRRTAVRAMVRRGIVEGVAMKMTGHKTRSVFERYNIVSESDLLDAAKRLNGRGGDSGGDSGHNSARFRVGSNS